MLNFILGHLGSGKTYVTDTQIINALSENKKVTLLVPEQEAIEAENRIYDRAVAVGAPLEKLSVVSFRRLANLAFRQHGGIEYDNLGESGRLIVIYRIVDSILDKLKIYKKPEDRSLIELLLSVCTELKRYCITPSMLLDAAKNTDNNHLKDKLTDIAQIYSEYCNKMSEIYADSSDDVNRLADIYDDFPPDKNELFFIDSFNGFTVPELRVIKTLIHNCNVTVSLTTPENNDSIGFLTLQKTKQQLLNAAKQTNVNATIIEQLTDNNDYCPHEFSLIKSKLFDNTYLSDGSISSERITLASCSDVFAQAEFIARRICELVRNGARYRDIVIITRNADKYDGVINSVFDRYGIPVFLSKRNKITDTAIYKAVYDALGVISDRFNTADIMSYIKSGVCGFTLEEIDIFESYVSLWDIDGKRFTDEADWKMNPHGFTDEVTDSGEVLLQRINSIRRRLITPLAKLEDKLNNVTVKNACAAIYNFISECGILEYYKSSSDPTDITAYNTFIELLDTLVLTASDVVVTAQRLSSLLYLMAKNTDYGSIPATFDRVTAGDASMLRCNGVKHVFLTDCENGSFPAGVSDDSFFSDVEKSFLSKNGIEISPDMNERNDLEAFYFLRAASGATESLTATYCNEGGKAHPSLAFKRLHELFPANEILSVTSTVAPLDRIQSLASFKDVYKAYKSSKYYDVIKKIASELDIGEDLYHSIPLSNSKEYISKENASELFGSEIGMSYSRFETYVKCPFSYFCKYVLGIKEKKYGYFSQADMGTYIHRILEKSLSDLFSNGGIAEKTDTDIERSLNRSFTEVVTAIIGGDTLGEGKRFDALISRLRRTISFIAKNIVAEFKNSDFTPKFFELEIGKKNGAITPLKIKVDDESTMFIKGKIDRVDTFDSDGKIYVKVLDYKSGSTEHQLSNVKYGLDTQMLLYLFSIWKDGNKDFARLIGKEGYDIIPAGVLYQRSSLPVKSTPHPLTDDEALEVAYGELVRNGILLDDMKIISSMEHGAEGRFLPVSIDDGETKADTDVLVSIDGFEELYHDITCILSEQGKKMKSGYASADPLNAPKTNPCRSCKLYPICRSRDLRCEDE